MSEPKRPADIAREALHRLAAGSLAPTPANFEACYNEIANLPSVAPFPEVPLRQIAGALQSSGEVAEGQCLRLDVAIGRHSWPEVEAALLAILVPEVPAAGRATAEAGLPGPLATRLAAFAEAVRPALGDENEGLKLGLADMARQLRGARIDLPALQELVARVARDAALVAEEQVEIKQSLLKLLQLIITNIADLSLDDSWLRGQVEGLLRVVVPPLTLSHLDEMEHCLREVVTKQRRAKARAAAAQEQMRQMLATFVARLASINESSAGFQLQIEDSARQIEQVRNIDELAPLLDGVLSATRNMAEQTRQSRLQLETLQERVLATESELTQLHLELDNASAQARHDPLTDVLNRKGLDEALARELASMQRSGQPLSLSLLDIDNFKRINDSLGHEAGDEALVHLARVARTSIRPTDTLARFGGEEFVILMPDTMPEQAVDVMTRLQRELTKSIFLAGNERILITFSAGVAQVVAGEEAAAAIRRADRAMYLAKRSGKNRVVVG